MEKTQWSILFPGGLTAFIATVVGLSLAVTMGLLIGEGETGKLMKVATPVITLLFAIQLHRYFWHTALFIVFIDFIYRPWGFAFGAPEITSGLGCAVIALFSWRKLPFKRPEIMEHGWALLMQRAVFVWLLYIALHIYYTFKDPYSPQDFAATNAAKSYFSISVPYFLLFYFGRRPVGIQLTKNFFVRIAQLCLAALVVSVGIKLGEILFGLPYVHIPVLEATNSEFTLRNLGPLASLIGITGLCAADMRENSRGRRFLFWPLLVLGILGAVISGGRAALVTTFLFGVAVLFLRKRVMLLILAAMTGLVGVVIANVFSTWINESAGPRVQRSLQWVLIEKNYGAMWSIEGSSTWRNELRRRAFAEWRSDPRIFWFGRATYGYGSEDEVAVLESGMYEANMQSALRRGATHNLITDLLIAYGLVGATLYLSMYLSIIYFLWRLHRSKQLSPPAENLTLVGFVGASCMFTISIFGGGGLPLELLWFVILLVASFYTGHGVLSGATRSDPKPLRNFVIRGPGRTPVPEGLQFRPRGAGAR